MSRKRERFVVGFDRDGQCIYGRDNKAGESQFIEAMPLGEARCQSKGFSPPGAVVTIYRLEKVEEQEIPEM